MVPRFSRNLLVTWRQQKLLTFSVIPWCCSASLILGAETTELRFTSVISAQLLTLSRRLIEWATTDADFSGSNSSYHHLIRNFRSLLTCLRSCGSSLSCCKWLKEVLNSMSDLFLLRKCFDCRKRRWWDWMQSLKNQYESFVSWILENQSWIILVKWYSVLSLFQHTQCM